MRTFLYNEQGHDNPLEITEEEILGIYYDYWSGKMKKARTEYLISKEQCIEDWCIVNWAWEKK